MINFSTDGPATERDVRILSMVDAYLRECLALEAGTSLGCGRLSRVLDRLNSERGAGERAFSQRPEFTCDGCWAGRNWKLGLIHVQPGRPVQNGRFETSAAGGRISASTPASSAPSAMFAPPGPLGPGP